MPKYTERSATKRKASTSLSPFNAPSKAKMDNAKPTPLTYSAILWQAQELLNRAQCEDDIQAVRALLRGVQQTF
jgi:hypothetical protein